MRKAVIIGILCLFPGWLTAQENKLNDTLQIRQVAVFGQAVSLAGGIRKMDSLALIQYETGHLAGLLEAHSPVFIKAGAPGSLATVSVRGATASHTRVTWNGIPLNSPMLGQVDFSMIPTFMTDEVRLLSGIASLAEGSGGIGGLVDLQSHLNWAKKGFGKVAVRAGSFRSLLFLADAGASHSKATFRIRLFREQSENDFPFVNTANGLFNTMRQTNADYNKQGVLAQAGIRRGHHHLFSLHAWLQNSHRNLPPVMSFDGANRTEYQDDQSLRLAAKWQAESGSLSVKAVSGLSAETLGYFLAHETGLGTLVGYDSHSRSNSWFNQLDFSWTLSDRHSFTVRAHADRHMVQITEQVSDGGYTADRSEYGVQFAAGQKWSDRFQSYVRLTQDWLDSKRTPFLPAAGLQVWLIPGSFNLQLNIGKNHHAPTLNDLYWIPGGNPRLIPEEGYQGDLGLSYMIQPRPTTQASMSTSLFVHQMHNWILWRPGEFRYWTPENVGTVLARGIEVDFSGEHQQQSIRLKTRFHYAWTRTHQTGRESAHQLMYIPIHKASLMVQAERASWYLTWQSGYTSERFTGTALESSYHRLPAYNLHHIGVGKTITIKKAEAVIRLQIRNLFDMAYQTILWRAMPGRHYSLTLSLNYS